jgi:hypothetical protein
MSKRSIVIGAVVFLWVIAASTAPALAAFEAAETKENSVKFENKETAAVLQLVEKESVVLEVKCGVAKGEGEVVETRGFTGIETKEDTSSTVPTNLATQVTLKTKLEKCQSTIGEEKGEATVNTEKCLLEIYQEETREVADVSLRAAKAGTQCKTTIEQPKSKCKVEFNAAVPEENEELASLKLKGLTHEVEIEAKSEVKGITVSTTECAGLYAKAEGRFVVAKPIVLKGVVQRGGFVGRSARRLLFKETKVGEAEIKSVKFIANVNVTFTNDAYINLGEGAFNFEFNSCDEATLTPGQECEIMVRFAPGAARRYEGTLVVRYTEGGNPLIRAVTVDLDGTGA